LLGRVDVSEPLTSARCLATLPEAARTLEPESQESIMLQTIGRYISTKISAGWDNTYWLMMEMDVTQWGILSVIFVVAGFMALRTRF